MVDARLTEKESKSIKNRLRLSEARSKEKFLPKVERSLDLWAGKQWTDDCRRGEKDCRVVVNYTLPTVETQVESIAFQYGEYLLKPMDEEGARNSQTALPAMTYELRMAESLREERRALRDAFTASYGICYTGWLFETEDVRSECGRPEDADYTPEEQVREDRFFVKRIDPRCFLIDPECDSVLTNARFCGYWELCPLEDVKADPRYQNTRKLAGSTKNLKGYFDTELNEQDAAGQAPQDLKRVKLYHYYERKRQLHVVMCDEHDLPLLVEGWYWEMKRYPFRVIQSLVPNDDFQGGLPIPLLIEHPQQEINEARSQLSDKRRTSNAKYQTPENLTPQQKAQVRSEAPNAVVEGVGQPITPIQHAQIQPEVFMTFQNSLQDIQTIAALNDYELMTPPTKRINQAEVAAIQQGGGARGAAMRAAFERFVAEIAEDCLSWLQQYATKTRSLPIYDSSDQLQGFRDYSGQEIRGKFHVEVYANSTSQPKREDQIQQIGFFLQSLVPALQAAPQAAAIGLDMRALIEQLLKSMPAIRHPEKILPPPGQQQPGMPGQMPPGMDPGMGGAPALPGGPPGMPQQGMLPAGNPYIHMPDQLAMPGNPLDQWLALLGGGQ